MKNKNIRNTGAIRLYQEPGPCAARQMGTSLGEHLLYHSHTHIILNENMQYHKGVNRPVDASFL